MTTLNSIAATVRGRRQELGLSQAGLAERADVSRKWIYEFEAGKPTAELGLLLRVLDALDVDIELQPRTDEPPGRQMPEAVLALDKVLARARRSTP